MAGRLSSAGKIVGVAGLCAVVWIGAPPLLRGLEFFRVRRVEITGLQYLEPSKVLAALRLSPKASVFDDPALLARRVLALPGITSAEIGRHVPGTLLIEVNEAVPVALAPRGDALTMVDAGGRVLPFDPIASAPDLPLAVADGVVARVLDLVRDSDLDLFGRIDAAWRVGPDVVLEVDGRRLWFGARASAEDIRAVMAVAQALARQGRAYQELDGRFAGQVIVRGVRA